MSIPGASPRETAIRNLIFDIRHFAWLLCAWALLAAAPGQAHPADEAAVYHYLWIEVRPGEVSLQHASHVGGLLTQAVWSQIDRDGDGQLSPAEQERHAR